MGWLNLRPRAAFQVSIFLPSGRQLVCKVVPLKSNPLDLDNEIGAPLQNTVFRAWKERVHHSFHIQTEIFRVHLLDF